MRRRQPNASGTVPRVSPRKELRQVNHTELFGEPITRPQFNGDKDAWEANLLLGVMDTGSVERFTLLDTC